MEPQPTQIESTAVVEADVSIGPGTRVWHHVQIRSGARIGSGCNIGKNVFVDSDVSIGNNCKIQNNVSIYRGVTIADSVFLGPSVVFTNDLHPRADAEDWVLTPTHVMEGASIGANATIVCGVTIGKHAMIGAGSVVTRSVPDHALVIGNPARQVGSVCICGRRIENGESLATCAHRETR